jgi:hypothetical protein
MGNMIYSVSRLNEPKVSEAKYKFLILVQNLFCRGAIGVQNLFCGRIDWSAKFILRPD